MFQLEEYIVSDSVNALIRFMKLACIILFVAHWIACFFWAVGMEEMQARELCWIRHAGVQDSAVDE